jgi:hypothetical protein
MADAVSKSSGKFTIDEPVVASSIGLWLVTNVGALLVGRTHLLTDKEWAPLASSITPIVIAAVLAVFAFIVRKVVAPAWKLVDDEAAKLGIDVPDLEVAGVTPVHAPEEPVAPAPAAADPAPVLAPDEPASPAADVPAADTPEPLVLAPDEVQA